MPDFTNQNGWQVQQLANLESNVGFQAYTVVSAAVPGSGVATANPASQSAIAVVVGGTVTVVAMSPTGVAGNFTTMATSTPTAIVVPPGGAIKLTWSVTPTALYWLTSALNVPEVDN